MSEHELKCPLAEGYSCLYPSCVYAGSQDFRQDCFEMNQHKDVVPPVEKPMPLSEAMLVDEWRRNNCSVGDCGRRRLAAALLVLRGGKTHLQYARVVEEAARDTK